MADYALRLQNSTDTAARVRMGDAMHWQQAGSLTSRTGLRRDGGGAVTVLAGTMQVQVSPFFAWVDGGTSTLQAGYPFVLDAAKTLTLADGHASLARVDTIAVRIRDHAFDASTFTDDDVIVITGTPGAGAPVLPATCLPLRDVNVPAGLSTGTGGLASGNLSTDRRKYTVATGGILPVATQAERDALGALAGQTVFREDTGDTETYNGSTWKTSYSADSWSVAASALLDSVNTTVSDVPGLTQSITVPGPSAVYWVDVSLDTACQATGANVFIAELVVDGVAQPAQIIANFPAVATRLPICKAFRVTGLSAGARTFKVTGRMTGAGGSQYRVNATQSTMVIQRLA